LRCLSDNKLLFAPAASPPALTSAATSTVHKLQLKTSPVECRPPPAAAERCSRRSSDNPTGLLVGPLLLLQSSSPSSSSSLSSPSLLLHLHPLPLSFTCALTRVLTRAMSSRDNSLLRWTRDPSGRMTRAEDAARRPPPCLVLTLPSHLLQEVLGFLGAADVARAATTCAAFRQASRS